MDEKLREIIDKKINESFSKTNEIWQLNNSLNELSKNSQSFACGIVIGRLYNSFFYQCKRILKRNPTEQEFSEFVELLKKRQTEFVGKFK